MKLIFFGDSNISPLKPLVGLTHSYHDIGQGHKTKEFPERNQSNIIYKISGASLKGIGSAGKLNTGEIIKSGIESAGRVDSIFFFMFGFVDINYVIPYKLASIFMSDPSPEKINSFDKLQYLSDSVVKYVKFIAELNVKAAIFEIPYNTISNPEQFAKIFIWYINDPEQTANAINYLKAYPYSQIESIQLTDKINKLLKANCEFYSIPFIEYNYQVIDAGKIKQEFIISEMDHHYNEETIGKIFFELIEKVVDKYSDNTRKIENP